MDMALPGGSTERESRRRFSQPRSYADPSWFPSLALPTSSTGAGELLARRNEVPVTVFCKIPVSPWKSFICLLSSPESCLVPGLPSPFEIVSLHGGEWLDMRIGTRRGTIVAGMTVLAFAFPGLASAQSPSPTTAPGSGQAHHAQGYVFVAPGAYIGYADSVAILHVGGGGEALIQRGLGIGAEIGAIGSLQESGGGLGLFSVNGSYHFRRNKKIAPFLTGGYSVVGGNGTRSLVNVGGGVNYWLRERVGIRLEFRDHFYLDGAGRQLLGFRIGFAFR